MGREVTTILGLTNKLTDEFAWRRKELKVLKDKIPSTGGSLQAAMLRSSVPLLYAHWEGFVKVAMSCYLEHVSRKYVPNNVLTPKFLALSLQNKLGDFIETSFESKAKIIELLFVDYSKKSNIPKKNIINTKSNLRFDVLKEILFLLDLEDSHIDGHKELINDLVDTRNHIAHGEYNSVDFKTYASIHDDVIALMEYLKTKIENNAVQKKYILAAPLITSP
ncbi:MAE_28990/MAE_18760 family HEPN-like nuclease [Sphingobacterium sp.]|uniref:MAE_28990/MAE_18760 family HEPN-like nuclease n=1 Tax=Sphingobacterium sp. TaxID=341027 RepID=UPI0028974EFD|nr:MAE_28990/MAE_18760 family HEPN-like nuclease [Sphingobacterium sp.]